MPVPLVVRPDPPLPMSVAIASRVFGSEILLALIRYYRTSPGTQRAAAKELDLPHQLVSKNTRILTDAAVVVVDGPARGRHGGQYSVDEQRLQELVAALAAYVLH